MSLGNKKYISIDRGRVALNRERLTRASHWSGGATTDVEGALLKGPVQLAPVICVELGSGEPALYFDRVHIKGESTVVYEPDHDEAGDPHAKAWIETTVGLIGLVGSEEHWIA